MSDKIRKEIEAEIINVMREAKQKGLDPNKYVRDRFPGIPDNVVTMAAVDLMEEDEEAWWQSMERTIDGEIIRNALTKKP